MAKAREKALEAHQHISDGINPSELRKAKKAKISMDNFQKKRLADGLPMIGSFEDVAREWGKEYVNNWNDKNDRTKRLLERNIFPVLGHKPINEITPAELRVALLNMKGILESAHRTFRICGRIFRYAVVNGKCEQDITLVLKGLLPAAEAKHFASITEPKEVKLLLQSIDGYEGSFIVKCAFTACPLGICPPRRIKRRRMGAY